MKNFNYKFSVFLLLMFFRRDRESGYALVTASIISALTAVLIGMYMLYAESIAKTAKADMYALNVQVASAQGLADRSDRAIALLTSDPNALLNNAALQSSSAFDCWQGTDTNVGNTACENGDRIRSISIAPKHGRDSVEDRTIKTRYNIYTSIVDSTQYDDFTRNRVAWQRLSAGDIFAGAISKSHVYTIGSLGIKQADNGTVQSRGILERNIEVRRLPVFQFARFSLGDDTVVLPSATVAQTFRDRYHANGNLTLVNDSGRAAILGGHWTIGGNFSADTGTNYAALPNGFVSIPNMAPLDYDTLYGYPGVISTRDTGFKPLLVPSAELLKPKDGAGNLQDYYGKAHLRIKRRAVPFGNAIPIEVTAIQSGAAAKGTAAACTDLSPDRDDLGSTRCQVFTKGMTISLMQPVLANNRGSASEAAKYCPLLALPNATMGNYTPAIQDRILRAVSVFMSTNGDVRFNLGTLDLPLNSPIYTVAGTNASLPTLLSGIPGLNAGDIPALMADSPQGLAAARKSCFLAPPVQTPVKSDLGLNGTANTLQYASNGDVAIYDRRENKGIAAIQVNVLSLAMWNREGIYVNFPDNDFDRGGAADVVDVDALVGSNATADGDLWVRTPADASKPGTLVESGLGAEGLVIHHHSEPSTTLDREHRAIVWSGASNLPAPTSLVSSGLVYVQGNFNSNTKQPAAIAGDTVTLLSDRCLAPSNYSTGSYTIAKGQINCANPLGMNLGGNTTINAAIASGVNAISGSNVDSVPIRYLEDWSSASLRMQTAFTIIGQPTIATGNFVAPGTGAYGASEYFRYPNRAIVYERDFDSPQGLPPVTPMAVQIYSDTVDRKFKAGERFNIRRILY